ncbi:TPA: restriction endonuclease subunit S [Escherichia coli]|uniref:restriction endonuclease subunit S n=1 Tax=Kluyvera cryocrescens TaxID=580 RepID=UPI0016502E12|nr:restriction endonuclease subunit S [Kluyvera cryocrescens]MEB7559362.1 restriction endonuclease subunit S [Kluyvera cryocrescens]HBD0043392.1 restriction endonuclease subunit S [Escherichia coli]
MVPKGWKKRDLHKLITIKHGFAFKSEYFSNDGQYVLLTPGSFNESGGFRNQGPKTKFYSGPIPNGYLLSKGDLLLAMTEQAEGLLGSPLFVPEDNKYLHNQRLGLVEINCPDKICSDFLYLLFNHADSRKQITEQSTGTKVKHTSPDRLCSVIGLIPPLLEQKKIAQILSTWDKAISVTEKLLANSQQQKKALMQQLLTGKKRLLNENGVRFSGKWIWLRAAELFKTISQKNNSEDEELLAVTQDLGVIPRSMLERRVVMPDGSTKGYKLVVSGNFIISLRSFQGGLEYSRYRGLVSPAYTVLTPIKKIVDEFYMQYYKSYDFIGHLAVAVIGIRDGKQISYEDFSFLKLPYPEIEEQQKIATVLSAADDEIATLEKKLACLRDEKKALMQQLLTGKRRVKVDEAVAE